MREFEVPVSGECRFEVDHGATANYKLLEGTGEVFGCELAPGKAYTATGQKLALFTYDGCRLEIASEKELPVEYVSTESVAVPSYLNLLSELQAGPKSMIILGAGRNTAARTVANYAARTGLKAVWASLDVASNPLFFPGCLSACAVGTALSPEEPSFACGEEADPVCLFYGSGSVTDNPKLWGRLVERLGALVTDRCSVTAASSIVIGPSGDPQFIQEWISTITTSFKANLIVVSGDERLHDRLLKHFSGQPSVKLVKTPKPAGLVSPRPSAFTNTHVSSLFKAYFYGTGLRVLNPFSTTLAFSDMQLFKVQYVNEEGSGVAPASALPLGAARRLDECRAVRSEPTASLLLYSVLAVLHLSKEDLPTATSKDLSFTLGNVAGFVYVTGVEEAGKRVTVLSPCPGSPPTGVYLVGRIRWIE